MNPNNPTGYCGRKHREISDPDKRLEILIEIAMKHLIQWAIRIKLVLSSIKQGQKPSKCFRDELKLAWGPYISGCGRKTADLDDAGFLIQILIDRKIFDNPDLIELRRLLNHDD